MSHQEIINVVSAHQEGKQIQTRSHFHPTENWQNCNPVWDFYQNDYRVAPEPSHLIKGYCFPMYIFQNPVVGMIKIEQVSLSEGENPIQPRKPREWMIRVHNCEVWPTIPKTEGIGTLIRVREVIE